mmetsp:Transcript_74055/g.239688  ORF Transcript_74055/g.239688 Transcript_74055/m.239688 type:complete len:212 (+) Transcript_74055:85-720(+)
MRRVCEHVYGYTSKRESKARQARFDTVLKVLGSQAVAAQRTETNVTRSMLGPRTTTGCRRPPPKAIGLGTVPSGAHATSAPSMSSRKAPEASTARPTCSRRPGRTAKAVCSRPLPSRLQGHSTGTVHLNSLPSKTCPPMPISQHPSWRKSSSNAKSSGTPTFASSAPCRRGGEEDVRPTCSKGLCPAPAAVCTRLTKCSLAAAPKSTATSK